ncbi:polyphosphate kinase 1 [candidate division KSB1 bacterium]|nr:polyphosphate kinase 1 [candidate division KSB1 bacterium]
MKTDNLQMLAETFAHPPFTAQNAFLNRELSWLNFARRVLALVEDREQPLLERVRFAGIIGMLHDEFFMKRMSGLKRMLKQGVEKASLDGMKPNEEMKACRKELLHQINILSRVMREEIRPALRKAGLPIWDYVELNKKQSEYLQEYFRSSVQPILTPLAVDAQHPFPFISSLGLNLAVQIPEKKKGSKRFLRIKVPNNRPRWVPLPEGAGFVPLEQVIAENLGQLFPNAEAIKTYVFRVTRGAEGEEAAPEELSESDPDTPLMPGSIIRQVTNELKARRFAGVVRLQVEQEMPEKLQKWLATQLQIQADDIYPSDYFIGLRDFSSFKAEDNAQLCYPVHQPVTPPRLRDLPADSSKAVFEKIRRGDILLHHPYHSFDTSVLQFIRAAAIDPDVLAIKLTIYRTSSDSPIVLALSEAARRGKQVAVLVEVTARFDEAPNIAWGQLLEREGVHVSYGVPKLKTHVKLALVVREERGIVRRYIHAGTGNYHTGTARVYEDLGILTCDPELCEDVAALFNELTGATPYDHYRKLIVAPKHMRAHFVAMIRREIEHAKAGRPCGIRAKMNQLQDPDIIQELYSASRAGVPIVLNVRGLNCLRPGVPEMSATIRVFSVVGRFLEHSRIYHFVNGGSHEYYIGSADWMKRNLDSRVETIIPVLSTEVKQQLAEILDVYESDNSSAWDCQPDGHYVRRRPAAGQEKISVQERFIQLANAEFNI